MNKIVLWSILVYLSGMFLFGGENQVYFFDLAIRNHPSLFKWKFAEDQREEDRDNHELVSLPVSPAEGIGDLPIRPPTPSDWKKLPEHVIYFDYDQTTISADAIEKIERSIVFLEKNPSYLILIEGHCDARGTPEYNLVLGGLRAKAVRSYMIQQGIKPERIMTKSWGEELPARVGQGEKIWSLNRRVEMFYSQL